MGWLGFKLTRTVKHTPTDEEREESTKVRILNNENKFLNDLLKTKNAEISSLHSERADGNMWGTIERVAGKMFGSDDKPSVPNDTKRLKAIETINNKIDEMTSEEIQEFVDSKVKQEKVLLYARIHGLKDDDLQLIQSRALAKIEPKTVEAIA